MTPRQMAAVLRRPFGGGSALAEPLSQEVYEGRLTRPAAAGVNFLDVREAAPARVYEAADEAPVQAWVPWCDDCRLEPMAAYTQGGAEYLARQHDAVHHGGAWTANAVPAAEVARLAAGGAR
jgi:hypothetical protein